MRSILGQIVRNKFIKLYAFNKLLLINLLLINIASDDWIHICVVVDLTSVGLSTREKQAASCKLY